MNQDLFWSIIQESQQEPRDCFRQADFITRRLMNFDRDGIIAFDKHFSERMSEAFRADLWAVAGVINGGCSNDGFDYFLAWMISLGREAYAEILLDPASAGTFIDKDDDAWCEPVMYCARKAYASKFGIDLPEDEPPGPRILQGKRLDEGEVTKRFPELVRRFR